MSVYIQNIATAVPPGSFQQTDQRDQMKRYINGTEVTKRVIHRIYSRSGIKKRHTVIDDLYAQNGEARFYLKKDGVMAQPSTKARNDLYTKHAKALFVDVADKLLTNNREIQKKDISHIITVSCTGFFAPGPAYEIVKKLGLPSSTKRFHIGFMGCYAVFPALKMACSFCQADPNATVLIVAVELCSLHLQASAETDQLISASVFADGASGALVSSRQPPEQPPAFRMEQFQSSIAADSEDKMAWTLGNTGFEMVLSSYVPEIIQANLIESIRPLLNAYNLNRGDIYHWAIHPGGRAILDKIEKAIDLQAGQLEPSRHVLANYGNMSSATILFVLQELLTHKSMAKEELTLAMAFGPGLTIETALLTKLPAG